MRRGEVVYCPRYTFTDGSQDDKLILNLNDPAVGEPYLYLLTTSQQGIKTKKDGCHSGYYAISKNIDFFDKEMTWILFYTLKEYSLKEELKQSWKGNFITKGFLKEVTLRAIINCIRNSNFLTPYQSSLLR